MNPDLNKLHSYPFEKLAELKAGTTPPAELAHIALSIGEPKHPTPGFITQAVIENLSGLSHYQRRLAASNYAKPLQTG